jgi:hypothetical protein
MPARPPRPSSITHHANSADNHAHPAERPYDHGARGGGAAAELGVPATEAARRARYGVANLLRIRAHCIDGKADAANQRITDVFGPPES